MVMMAMLDVVLLVLVLPGMKFDVSLFHVKKRKSIEILVSFYINMGRVDAVVVG